MTALLYFGLLGLAVTVICWLIETLLEKGGWA